MAAVMNALLPALCLCVGAYVAGSIPFGVLVARLKGVDLRAVGSGNIGATNVARSGAKGLGLATLALDLGKAWLAVFLAQRLSAGLRDRRMLLLVDDDVLMRIGLRRLLGREYSIVEAGTVEEALAHVREQPGAIDGHHPGWCPAPGRPLRRPGRPGREAHVTSRKRPQRRRRGRRAS